MFGMRICLMVGGLSLEGKLMKYLTKSHEEAHKNSKKLSAPLMSQEQAKAYAMEAWDYKRPQPLQATRKDVIALDNLLKRVDKLLAEVSSMQS